MLILILGKNLKNYLKFFPMLLIYLCLELKVVSMANYWMVCILLEYIMESIIQGKVVLFDGLKCLLYKYLYDS